MSIVFSMLEQLTNPLLVPTRRPSFRKKRRAFFSELKALSLKSLSSEPKKGACTGTLPRRAGRSCVCGTGQGLVIKQHIAGGAELERRVCRFSLARTKDVPHVCRWTIYRRVGPAIAVIVRRNRYVVPHSKGK